METYIFLNNQWTEIQIEINPSLVKALDTTNDTFSCILKASTQKEPVKPMTPFKVIYDDNSVQVFWIINDSVSVFSLNPESYKHSLTLVQYRYFLNKHLVRNTVFNQPKIQNIKLYCATSNDYLFGEDGYGQTITYVSGTNGIFRMWYDKVPMLDKYRIRKLVFKYEIYGLLRTWDENQTATDTWTEITNLDISQYRAYFQPNTYIQIFDEANDTVICQKKLFDLDVNTEITLDDFASDVNAYLKTHHNTIIKIRMRNSNWPQTDQPTYFPTARTDGFVELTSPIQKTDHYDYYYGFLFQATMTAEMYAYSLYDVIETLLQQHRLHSNYGYKRELLFNLPTESSTGEDKELYDLLTTTYPPDTLAFTQATFYEALTEIFRFFDAGFTFDENKMLKIEYYNNREKQINIAKKSGLTLLQADKNFNNGRVAYYQNSIQRLKIPLINVTSSVLGVPQDGSFSLVLPKPIYAIEKIEMYVPSYQWSNTKGFIDMTPFFVSRNEWSVLPIQFDGNHADKLTQRNTIPFDRGSNVLNISNYYSEILLAYNAILGNVIGSAVARFNGNPTNVANWDSLARDIDGLLFKISYYTNNSGRIQIETVTKQYNGQMLVNQGNGYVDVSKLGHATLSESLKDGEPTLTVSYELNEWSQRVKEGDYFIDNGAYWVANVINYKILPNGKQQCSIEFSKNFNLLSMRIQSDKEKRLTAISSELAILSEDNYIDYVYVRDEMFDQNVDNQLIPLSIDMLRSMVGMTFDAEDKTVVDIDFVGIKSYVNGQVVTEINGEEIEVFIPLIKYGSGNCVCFEMQYESPIDAGTRMITETGNIRYAKATPYTDEEGWADEFDITFYAYNDAGKAGHYSVYPIVVKEIQLPLVPDPVVLADQLAKISHLKFYKKPNEIFALNYEWCFLVEEKDLNDVFIGNKFIVDNSFTTVSKSKHKFYLRYGTEKYAIMDTKGTGDRISLEFKVTQLTKGFCLYLKLPSGNPDINAKCWAIVDEDNDIYFASNHERTFTSSFIGTNVLCFYTRKSRI